MSHDDQIDAINYSVVWVSRTRFWRYVHRIGEWFCSQASKHDRYTRWQ